MPADQIKLDLTEVAKIVGLVLILSTQWYSLSSRIDKIEQYQELALAKDMRELKEIMREQKQRIESVEDIQRSMWSDIKRVNGSARK